MLVNQGLSGLAMPADPHLGNQALVGPLQHEGQHLRLDLGGCLKVHLIIQAAQQVGVQPQILEALSCLVDRPLGRCDLQGRTECLAMPIYCLPGLLMKCA